MKKHNIAIFVFIFIFALIISFAIGRYSISPISLLKALFGFTITAQEKTIIFNLRLPRIIIATFLGAGLSLSGLVYQGIFQNPMVSPDLLGSTSGAGFGAALAILLGLSYLEITLVSFLFGILAVSFVLLISSRVRGNPTLTLVLSGMMVSSVFSALISFIKLIADPEEALPQITYFLMGSLSSVRKQDILPVVILIVIAIVPIVILRWSLNIMTQGEEEAKALGVNTRAVRLASIISATIVTATATSLCGMISYVGLVIPHLVRMITGCDYRKTVPASILLGASFLLLVDTISRSIATVELPIGILTSLIGAPFFLYLILREAKKL
ncbi:iron ABC transporter permease [Bullifex porci]|uniref:FecCD family ABC transporter permease n=1 Tax=Bullifex porci TaxID=2606638 RepID=UPI0023F3EB77|nr:iron ABC transporter permease [Bullifex porci]MDD7256393.1 iron ABC transporter permease [Bullifex porci]MDY2741252.1 iron ABC transporter permease [Bullifex porci]